MTTSREGENTCIDESFDDVMMPKAIDSGEFCLSRNAHESRAFSELLVITEGDEMALPKKDEFSMDEMTVNLLNKIESITKRNNKILKHDEYNIFLLFRGWPIFLKVYICLHLSKP